MTSQFIDMTSSTIFLCCRISLVKFSYWCKFDVNIITGSRVIRFFLIRDRPGIQKLDILPSES